MNRWSVPIFLVGVGIGWIFLPTPLWICGVYANQSMPAWVQAVGSVLAIVAAIFAAGWQQHLAHKAERAATARRMIVTQARLYSALTTLGTAAQRLQVKWARAAERPQAIDGLNELIGDTNLWSDGNVKSHTDMLHEFDEPTCKVIMKTLAKCDQYHELHGSLYDSADRQTAFGHLGGSLAACAGEIAEYAMEASRMLTLAMEMEKYPAIRKRVQEARAKPGYRQQ
jgi:hypothetical protein